ncbi:MAG: serine/threonine protein kinase [Planctomycetales bacterium]|nr:serine/threonine protein kinase [Planctomycetales bacterium]
MTDSAPRDPIQTADLSGRRLGDYQILRRLGRGAMAEVYLAEQLSLERKVAVKVLKAELVADTTHVERFQNEARAAAKLTHANIVQIYEVGQWEKHHFIAQEYVPGRNLGEIIARQGPLAAGQLLAVLRQVAAALHKAAEAGIVHRDIKPENIMISPSGEVKVADFGLARVIGADAMNMTQIGVTMGTPLYMSPEQIEGKPLDIRSDIYSLGVTCFHLLAGRPPFTAETALAVAVQHLNTPPERLEQSRPDLPPGLCRIVHKMMSKKPAERHASPRELLAELRDLPIDNDDKETAQWFEQWSTAEMVALSGGHFEATQRLDDLMKTSAMITAPKSWPRWTLLACLGGFAVGVVGAVLSRSPSLLADAQTEEIPQRETAWQQLYHAKLTNTEAAWRKVWEYFPPGDAAEQRFTANLAMQGLARYYIWDTGQTRQARPLLEELAALPPSETAFRAFGLAGLCIVASMEQRQQEAVEKFGSLTPAMLDSLDPEMRQLLIQRMSSSRNALNAEARGRLERLGRGAAAPVGG